MKTDYDTMAREELVALLTPDGDPERWKSGDISASGAETHRGMVYGIQSPFTGQLHYPPEGGCWRFEKPRMKSWLQEWGSAYVERDLRKH